MDFLWFWVFGGVLVEVTRRSVNSCYPKTLNKADSDLDSLKKPLLESVGSEVDTSKCPYSCCTQYITTYETNTEESLLSTESTDEIVSSSEVEEYEDSLVNNRRAGKQVVQDNDGVEEVVGRLYSSAFPGRPKLIHFKVSDNHFRVSDTVGARLAKEMTSAKIHPHPNGVTDQASSPMRNSSAQFSKDKQGAPLEEIADEYRILPPIQEVMSSHRSNGNMPGSDEIRPSEGQCSY